MFYRTPGSKVASATFRNKCMDMGIPFQVPSKSMEDTDNPGGKVFGMVEVVKHAQDYIPDGRKEKV